MVRLTTNQCGKYLTQVRILKHDTHNENATDFFAVQFTAYVPGFGELLSFTRSTTIR